MGLTNYPGGVSSFGVPVLPGLPIPFTGKYFFVDPANGSDGNSGLRPDRALATLYKAHSLMRAGKNDVALLMADGGTTATARLSLANAVAVDPDATTGKLTWSKNACHLVGICPPAYNRRARIAPPTGIYTQETFNSGDFFEASASGCYFANFALFHGFSTGGADQIALTVSGSRNYFAEVDIFGMADQEAADDAGSRDLLVEGAENVFERCNVGLDTVTRGAANASVQFSTTASKRNRFLDCFFPFMTDSADVLGISVDGAGESDRWQEFVRCRFINAIGSTSTTMSALATLAASIGGHILLTDCVRHGITEWGTDATSRGQIYIGSGGNTPNGHTAGETVVSSTS